MTTIDQEQKVRTAALAAACAHLPGADPAAVQAALDAARTIYEEADKETFNDLLYDSDAFAWQLPPPAEDHIRNSFLLATRWVLHRPRIIGVCDYATFRMQVATGRHEPKTYELYVCAPGGATPQKELREARMNIGAALELTCKGEYPLIAPGLLRAALGQPGECSCPGGAQWETDFDPECEQHGTPMVSDRDIALLLPAARKGASWAQGQHASLYAGDPDQTPDDGLLVNVLHALLDHLREPTWNK